MLVIARLMYSWVGGAGIWFDEPSTESVSVQTIALLVM